MAIPPHVNTVGQALSIVEASTALLAATNEPNGGQDVAIRLLGAVATSTACEARGDAILLAIYRK